MTTRDEAVAAFAEVATPAEKNAVAEINTVINETVAAAGRIDVRTAAEAEHATEFLTQIAGAKRRAEQARKFLVGPLNAHVKSINEKFKEETVPLEQADAIVRAKVLAYRREQERLRVAEQARLDAERAERERQAEEQRRREEAEARAAREAAARESARAEAEARAAERRRREQLDREAGELSQEMAGLSSETLLDIRAGTDDRARAAAAGQELQARRAAREAQERAAAARQREEDARAAEQAARDRPLPEAPRAVVASAAPLRSASGRVAERKTWRGTVVDKALVPREYLKVDQAAINAAVRAGARQIPGVLIEQVDELAVRAS